MRQRTDKAVQNNIALSRRLASETEIVYTKSLEIKQAEQDFHVSQQALTELTSKITSLKNALRLRLEEHGDVMAHDFYKLVNDHLQSQDLFVHENDFALEDHANIWDENGNNIAPH